MPLRDHFHPPISKQCSWEGFHGYWPGAMVRLLVDQLPQGYVAEPRVHLGAFFEIDVCAFEKADFSGPVTPTPVRNGGVVVTLSPPAPTFALDTEIPEQYEYEVLIYDVERDRRLVAAVEIVSPANKDRPENRQMFAAKCAALLQKGVCVSIVDLVTIRRANLYVDLLALIGCSDPAFTSAPSSIYAVTCRKRMVERKTRFETWSYPLAIGQPLPTLPVWLSEEHAVLVNLEASYEESCRVLRVP